MKDRKLLALWAADCAERVLPLFELRRPRDQRPRNAIAAARAWARGEITCGAARSAAIASHAAARATAHPAARAAARSAGHAAATAHMAAHARPAATYAATASANPRERNWQRRRLPAQLRPGVFPENARATSPVDSAR